MVAGMAYLPLLVHCCWIHLDVDGWETKRFAKGAKNFMHNFDGEY